MKRILLAAVALATLTAPVMASAQPYNDTRHDRREVQQDQRELQHDRRDARSDGRVTNGERREIQSDRRELQGDRRDLRNGRFDRSNPNWWRSRADFRGYTGRRAGFYYAPGYGYRQIDRRWAGHRWSRGQYVPYGFRTFYVQDPYFYNLRPAPYGYRWVYLDGNIVLMAVATGFIADMIFGAY